MTPEFSRETLSDSISSHIDPKRGHYRPNNKHYGHGYRWDQAQISIALSETGEPDVAAGGVEKSLSWQNPATGFIPNIRLTPHRWLDPERWTFKNPFKESDYPQPPLEAEAAKKTFYAYKKIGEEERGKEFLRRNYDALKLDYFYFPRFLQNEDSALIGVFHPSATGRDSGPDSRFGRPGKLSVNGERTPRAVYMANTVIDYLSLLALNIRLRAVNWEPQKARKIFWMNDVMFNCIYANNMEAMGEIAETLEEGDDAKEFNKMGQAVKDAIIERMWDDKSGCFRSLDTKGRPIEEITVGNLYGITLSGLDVKMTKYILDYMNTENMFGTTFRFPSVPKSSRFYDPSRKEKRLWLGPVWANTNLHLIEGLMKRYEEFKVSTPQLAQECFKTASYAAKSTVYLFENAGPWECWNSENGDGLRLKPFAWSIAVYHHVKAKYPQLLAA